MINALHSSRENGTKAFQHKGSTFIWIDIYKMWMRECERRGKGDARMVPKLRETHIKRFLDEVECVTSKDDAGIYTLSVGTLNMYVHVHIIYVRILLAIFCINKYLHAYSNRRYCLSCTVILIKPLHQEYQTDTIVPWSLQQSVWARVTKPWQGDKLRLPGYTQRSRGIQVLHQMAGWNIWKRCVVWHKYWTGMCMCIIYLHNIFACMYARETRDVTIKFMFI